MVVPITRTEDQVTMPCAESTRLQGVSRFSEYEQDFRRRTIQRRRIRTERDGILAAAVVHIGPGTGVKVDRKRVGTSNGSAFRWQHPGTSAILLYGIGHGAGIAIVTGVADEAAASLECSPGVEVAGILHPAPLLQGQLVLGHLAGPIGIVVRREVKRAQQAALRIVFRHHAPSESIGCRCSPADQDAPRLRSLHTALGRGIAAVRVHPFLQFGDGPRLEIELVFHGPGDQRILSCSIVEQQQPIAVEQLCIVWMFEGRPRHREFKIGKGSAARPDELPRGPADARHHVHVPQAQKDVAAVEGLEGLVVVSVEEGGIPVAVRAPIGWNVVGSAPEPKGIPRGILLLNQTIDDGPLLVEGIRCAVSNGGHRDFLSEKQGCSVGPELHVVVIGVGPHEVQRPGHLHGAVEYLPYRTLGVVPRQPPIRMEVHIETPERVQLVADQGALVIDHQWVGEVRTEPWGCQNPAV